MNVVFAIPTANPAQCSETFAKWREMGYLTAALVDGDTPLPENANGFIRANEYHGWAWAVNALCSWLLNRLEKVDWVCVAGDDMLPDPHQRADEIAAECIEHFGGTNGVMQPTGDPFGIDASGRCAAERICGSPWLGHDFILSRGGKPFDEAFRHYFADEKLHDELINTPLLWQRKDLTHYHHHWSRTGKPRPKYMEKAAAMWAQDETTFRAWQRSRIAATE